MARTLIEYCGFDALASADIATRIGAASGSPDATIVAGRNSGSALQCKNASSSVTWPWPSSIPVGDRVIFGSAFQPTGSGGTFDVLSWQDTAGTPHVVLQFTPSSGLLTGTRNGVALAGCLSVTPMSTGTWYYLEVEFVVSDAAGEFYLRQDGVDQFGVTGLDTRNAGNGNISTIIINGSGTGRGCILDDTYHRSAQIADAAKSSWFGDSRISALLPGGAGNSAQFTPSAGSNFANVDDPTQDGDSTYNESTASGQTDTFAMTNLPSAGSVLATLATPYARKIDAGTAALDAVYRIGSTDYPSGALALGTTYRYLRDLRETSPATAVAWTDTEVNAAEMGYKTP